MSITTGPSVDTHTPSIFCLFYLSVPGYSLNTLKALTVRHWVTVTRALILNPSFLAFSRSNHHHCIPSGFVGEAILTWDNTCKCGIISISPIRSGACHLPLSRLRFDEYPSSSADPSFLRNCKANKCYQYILGCEGPTVSSLKFDSHYYSTCQYYMHKWAVDALWEVVSWYSHQYTHPWPHSVRHTLFHPVFVCVFVFWSEGGSWINRQSVRSLSIFCWKWLTMHRPQCLPVQHCPHLVFMMD